MVAKKSRSTTFVGDYLFHSSDHRSAGPPPTLRVDLLHRPLPASFPEPTLLRAPAMAETLAKQSQRRSTRGSPVTCNRTSVGSTSTGAIAVGPGDYDVKIDTVGPQTLSQHKTMPAFSFGVGGPLCTTKNIQMSTERSRFPGPGNYPGAVVSSVGNQFLSTRKTLGQSNSFGTGIRDPTSPLRSAKDTVPGAANVVKPLIKSGPAPGDYGRGPESIGNQTLSQRPNQSVYSFGGTAGLRKRDRFKMDRVTVYGADSPGPAGYEGRIPSFGTQPYSNTRRVPAFAFGTRGKFGGNFKKPLKQKASMMPGPGKYILLSAIGKQKESMRPSSAMVKFGTSTRADMYAHINRSTPGPGAYPGFLNKEELFGRAPPAFGFGTQRKFQSKAVVMKDLKRVASSSRSSPRSISRRLINAKMRGHRTTPKTSK